MATKKPRIQVTLDTETDAVVRRLASLSNQSCSAVIGSIIVSCQEPLGHLCEILERAQALQESLPQATKEAVHTAANELEELSKQATAAMDSLSRQLKIPDLGSEAPDNPHALTGGSTYSVGTPPTTDKPIQGNKKQGGYH